MKTMKLKLAAAASFMMAAFSVNAQYSDVYVFGDSLSDNGNLVQLDPNVPERFTNGPVAVEVVAGAFGVQLTPSSHLTSPLPTGNNFAIAGAKAVDDDGDESTPDINLPTQVNAFLASQGFVAPSDALYIVLIGGNDIRAAREIRAAGLLGTPEEAKAAREAARESIRTAVESQQAQIAKLIASGAQNILVANAPDIGAIPETDLVALQVGAQAADNKQARKATRLPKVATKLSAKYNRILARKVAQLENQTGVEIEEFDLFGFLGEQIDAAEDFGYTNTDDACIYIFSQGGVPNSECIASAPSFPTETTFLFWDEIHPTTRAHQNAGIAIVGELLAQ